MPSRKRLACVVDDLRIPTSFIPHFPGFSAETFAVLDRLREAPHVETLRVERENIAKHVKAPFEAYRDDLTAALVLPNRLPWETEKGVFSRLPKNDFGAGGAHAHLWMSFYRSGYTRLTDVQFGHSLSSKGLRLNFYVGDYMREGLERLRAGWAHPAEKSDLLERLNHLPDGYTWTFLNRRRERFAPEGLEPKSIGALVVQRDIPRDDVLSLGSDLVFDALAHYAACWSVYRWVVE